MSDAEHGPPTRTVTEHLPSGKRVRAKLHDERVVVSCDGERWVFAIDIETARLINGDDVPGWMEHLLAHFGIEEVDA